MIACISSALYFNPHLPCGRRLDIKFYLDRYEAFQSTPSLRKATFIVIPLFLVEIFQSTPSLRKATIPAYDRYSKVTFQSTPSLRKATANISQITSEFLLASNKTLLFWLIQSFCQTILHISVYLHLKYRCESPGILMFTWHSHFYIKELSDYFFKEQLP